MYTETMQRKTEFFEYNHVRYELLTRVISINELWKSVQFKHYS